MKTCGGLAKISAVKWRKERRHGVAVIAESENACLIIEKMKSINIVARRKQEGWLAEESLGSA
jgi:hypothetical protein